MFIIPAFIRRRIAHRPNLVNIIDNIGWLFIDRVLRMGIGLFVGAWVARYLGPEQFGQYSYAIAFVSLFSAFSGLGLGNIVIRDLARDPDDFGVTLGTAFALQLTGGGVAFALVVISIFWMHPEDGLTRIMVVIMGLTLVFKASHVIIYWFESQVQSRYVVWVGSSAFFLIAGIKVLMLVNNAPLVAFAWVALADSIVMALGIFTIYTFKAGSLHLWSVKLDRVKTLLGQSWPLILYGSAIMIQAKIDQLMLGNMLGNEEVGQYSAGMRLIEAFYFMPVIVVSTLAPSLAKAKLKSGHQFKNLFIETYRIMVAIFLAIFFSILFFGEEVVVLVFGSDYERAGGLMLLLSINLLFTSFGLVRSQFITNEGIFKYALITSVFGAVLNVAINYLLIPSFRSEGAIIATVISFFVTIFLIDFFVKRANRNALWMIAGIVSVHKVFKKTG